MRACLLAIAAAFVCAAPGCAGLNLSRRSCDESCTKAVGCSKAAEVPCAQPVGCAQPIGCAAAVSPAAPAAVAPLAPAGVSPYVPPAAVAPYGPAGGYGGGRVPHFPAHRMGGGGGAVVAYPYYTIRGPRDFLMDNPPSIGR